MSDIDLNKLREHLFADISKEIDSNNYRYETFGKDIENAVCNSLINFFTVNKYIVNENDYKIPSNKNEFPDFTLIESEENKIAFEIKSGNIFKKDINKWVSCKNSNNDLGTINKWNEKIRDFGGDNIFFVYIIYAINDKNKYLVRVEVDNFYKFIEINYQGFLCYREKDGNLRPKNFGAPSKINSFSKFMTLLADTNIQRSKNIIKKHIKTIPKEQLNAFLDSLRVG